MGEETILAGMRFAVVAVVLGLVLAGYAAAQSGEDGRATREPLRVLFVGNSLTATNDLPAIVAALGRASKRVPIEYATVAPGGVNLEDHWNFTGARDALLARPWDVVVLQQGPSSLPESQADLKKWAVRWADLARDNGIRTALLTVWPEDARSYAFPAVVQSYRAAAAAANGTLLPAGAAWLAAWRRAPRLALYGPDDFHPSVLGSTLAALVVYARLTGTPPSAVPLPYRARTARILRLAAAEALR
jgi:hypothetical protein